MFNMNINAEEFIPSDNSPYMIEMKWFDTLEEEFIKMNEWLFDYCPLEKVIEIQDIELKDNELKDDDDIMEVEFIYEPYKYKEGKFKSILFKSKLETIYEENPVLTYAECLKK